MYTKMEKSLEQKLASAEEYAQKGDACIMDAYLSSAQTCAQKVGRDISAEVQKIKKILKNRIELST